MSRSSFITVSIAALLLAVTLSSCSSRKPLIGVTPGYSSSSDDKNVGYVYNGTTRLLGTYIETVIRAGGVPVILPAVRDSLSCADILSRLDGMMISGGEDLDPAYYGESIIEGARVGVNAQRDTVDMLYARTALAMKKPIFAICRGFQLLNVALGGSLYQDLPTQIPDNVGHSQREPGNVGTHKITIEKGSTLRKVLKADTLWVNSYHHQGVKDLAKGVKVTARTDDGLIEGYEGKNIYAVQFHPEKAIDLGEMTLLPYVEDFVSKCR
ncbi:MAG: gamma-glutamyl-gamma-aminobutyrate hydrolase family protein [Bacteroidales bacterium]|nr:gamma-glutamyl-gamma-aminobutyrate hydrolase family protein [Bacteroidales bacterium]MBQ9175126.1 gamma-glutamyl-gamma-aminobutyrate hydrolase family protein [Bacteroidales bacterium]